ncbi:MAG: hypothetical protein ACRDKG_07765 [Actinomycetota bacterium]
MKKTTVVLALGLLLAVLATMMPAQAAVAFRFQGSASLPTFPCVPGGCVGTFSGTAQGQLDEVGGIETGPISASFTYQENNCEVGTAVGSGSINGLPFTFTWNRTANVARITGTYAGGAVSAVATFTTTPAVPGGCLPGGAPGPVTANVNGAAAGL